MIRRQGFTLIELLFVVATIAVLAAIAVPNFLEAQVRAKISRVHQDMATVTSGLRTYYADHNRYPPHSTEVQEFLEACAKVGMVNAETTSAPLHAPYAWTDDDPFIRHRQDPLPDSYSNSWGTGTGRFPILLRAGYDLAALTTPIAYAEARLPFDPFSDRRTSTFVYVNMSDIPTTGTPEHQRPGAFKRYVVLSYGPNTDFARPDFKNPVKGPWLPYDPTNGTVSPGDILQFGNYDPGVPTSDLVPETEPEWPNYDFEPGMAI